MDASVQGAIHVPRIVEGGDLARRLRPGLAVSVMLHAALIGALIALTGNGPLGSGPEPIALTLVFPDGPTHPGREPRVAAMPAAVIAPAALGTLDTRGGPPKIIALAGGSPHRRDIVSAADPTDTPSILQAGGSGAVGGEQSARPTEASGQDRAEAARATPATPLSGDYVMSLLTLLARHKHYPDAARSRGEEGTVLIAFVIARDGRLISCGVRRSSGSQLLDRAAEDMVRSSDPLPALPADYQGSQLAMELPTEFSLQ